MRSREEYLIKYEEGLLAKLSSTFSSLNRDIIVCFSLLLVFFLFQNQLIDETTIVGNKLKLSLDQSSIILPILICIVYFSINNSTLRIAKIVNLLKANSNEIKTLNSDSRTFIVQDLDYLTEGVAGIQLQFSRWIVRKFLSRDLINFEIAIPEKKSIYNLVIFTITLPLKVITASNQVFSKLLQTSLWLLLLVFVYLVPLGIPALVLYNKKVDFLFDNFQFPESIVNSFFLVFALLIIIIFYTLVSNLILYSFYFSELVELKENVIKNSYSKITRAFLRVGKYYIRK